MERGVKAMVIIYGKSNCTFCEKAKQLCIDYQLEYEYKNVVQIEYLEEFVEKLSQLFGKASITPPSLKTS